ncbi:response regulator transcription factor [Allostreptomyces psammosilenae]|uniref:DNA-binding response OmpR family regulator n=1 Tax=Allostreptomyces psammosilenae TaxID=1892865 RepID=A0A852ZXW4_9ACTN|nr:response regulator transcription factor [Allostreptomyces psammosilenae]NYI07213.1 DNA-binding response OmpR family regulator [Allostreptomyces psammosilenae]
MARVLLVEDDPSVGPALARELAAAAHTVHLVGTAMRALGEVARAEYDVVVLDVAPPDADGTQVLRMVRRMSDVAVIVATDRDDETEAERLRLAGADAHLPRPLSGDRLADGIAAVLGRIGGSLTSGPAPRLVLRVGALAVDVDRRQASLDGVPLDLTRREFDLLAHLAARPGTVVSRRELFGAVWRRGCGGEQTVDVHLSWLRRKLGENASAPRYLHTVRGVGVKLQAPTGDDAD